MNKIVLLIIALFVTACGYNSLYKETKEIITTVHVRNVEVGSLHRLPNERRVAQLVNRRLSQVFTAEKSGNYLLDINITESRKTLAVLRDATENRFEIILNAELNLDNNKSESIFKSNITESAPYNVETSPYGTDTGKDRARESAAISLAEEIIQQINYFIYTQGKKQ